MGFIILNGMFYTILFKDEFLRIPEFKRVFLTLVFVYD